MSTYRPGGGAAPPRPKTDRRCRATGKFACEIAHVEKNHSFKSGIERLSFQFKILAGPQKDLLLFDAAYLNNPWKLEKICEVTGIAEEFSLDDPIALVTTFVGKRLWVTQDKDGNEWTDDQGVVHSDNYKCTAYHKMAVA